MYVAESKMDGQAFFVPNVFQHMGWFWVVVFIYTIGSVHSDDGTWGVNIAVSNIFGWMFHFWRGVDYSHITRIF